MTIATRRTRSSHASSTTRRATSRSRSSTTTAARISGRKSSIEVRGHTNVRLIRKRTNTLCGPATNTSLVMGSAELAIYVCSKEGFVKEHGWEQVLIDYMRSNPTIAMAGHKVHLPKYVYGSELAQHPEFAKFRNQDFARARVASRLLARARRIVHRKTQVLVGCRWIQSVDATGQHGRRDVVLPGEQRLCARGNPGTRSVTTKTLPRLHSVLDERTVAAHPLTCRTAMTQLDSLLTFAHWRIATSAHGWDLRSTLRRARTSRFDLPRVWFDAVWPTRVSSARQRSAHLSRRPLRIVVPRCRSRRGLIESHVPAGHPRLRSDSVRGVPQSRSGRQILLRDRRYDERCSAAIDRIGSFQALEDDGEILVPSDADAAV